MDFIMDTNRCVFYGFIHLHADRIRLHTIATSSSSSSSSYSERTENQNAVSLPLPKRILQLSLPFSRRGIQFDLDYIFELKMYFCIISLCRLSSYVENKNPRFVSLYTHNSTYCCRHRHQIVVVFCSQMLNSE